MRLQEYLNEGFLDTIKGIKANREQKKIVKHIVEYVRHFFPSGGKWRMGEVKKRDLKDGKQQIQVYNVRGEKAIEYIDDGKNVTIKNIGPGMWSSMGDVEAQLK